MIVTSFELTERPGKPFRMSLRDGTHFHCVRVKAGKPWLIASLNLDAAPAIYWGLIVINNDIEPPTGRYVDSWLHGDIFRHLYMEGP